ncbi:hypothetical protein J437_LFUL010247 [Ladona fulva]|uniref:Ciliogenesis-associated TTC17-interacting protein N-terminal domain-containing protein n=1 Tax=Ladona fulva TaxID=123851 RepID=A0A8K0P385_LADFU|nr:hypothetical protein J437_LFUL010247 [Ladona fulva]
MKEMENGNSNNDSGDQESDRKGFSFRKNHLTRGNIIDGGFSNSVCFREALTILSEDNIDMGQLSVNIDKEKDASETIYIVFVSLTEYIERFKHTNTVFGRVTHDFTTLEERRSECLQLGEEKIERNVTLVNEADEYCVSLSFFDGKDWERDSLEITKEDSLTLMGEAANYLYVSSPIGASKLGRDKREVNTMCVKRMLLNPKGKITAEWILTKGAGYILEERREIPHGSVTHPMMRYCNGNDSSNEGDDISEDECLNILKMELTPGGEEKRNTAEEGEKPLKNDARKKQPTETFGNPVEQGENEETQVMEGGENLTPGNEMPMLDKVTKDHGGIVIAADSVISEEIISKVSINSDEDFQKKKTNNRTLTEGIAEEQARNDSYDNSQYLGFLKVTK